MARPVLVLGAEPRVAVTIARTLHRHGIPVAIAACSPDEAVPSSRAITHGLRLPSPRHDPDHFGMAVLEMVRRHGFDMVVPSSDTTLAGLAEQYARLTEGCLAQVPHLVHFGCPAPHVVRQVLDKSATLAAARRCGIPVPFTVEVTEAVELEGLLDALQFPAIVKPRSRHLGGSSKVRHVQTHQELARLLQREHALRAAGLIQEYCPGVGVGIELLMDRGEPIALFQHRRVKELPASGGVSVLSIAEPLDHELVDQSIALLRELRWQGVAMVEFRYDRRSRRAVLMEVNGRYWGSLALSVRAGLEFPYYEWQLAHGQRPVVPQEYRSGVRCRWTRGLLLRAQQISGEGTGRWTTVMETIKDLGPSAGDALWSMNDPGPAARELRQTVGALVRHLTYAGLKQLLPTAVIDLVRGYRLLGSRDGRIYVGRGMLRMFGLRRDQWQPLPSAIRSILFVCHGNILRSPMAASLLQQALAAPAPQFTIRSAGLHAKPYGPADDRGCTVATEFGCSLDAHESQMVSKDLVDQAQLIFVMDRLNEAKLLGRFPKAAHKVRLLGACEGNPKRLDITDPYSGDLDDVRECYRRLAACIQRLATVLAEQGGTASVQWTPAPITKAAEPVGEDVSPTHRAP